MKKITESLIYEYKKFLANEEKAGSTIEKYIRDIEKFYMWLGDCDLSKETVVRYKEKLISEYAPASVNSIISSLNSFFSYNERHDLKVKILKIQKQIFLSREKELTKAEYERLLRSAMEKKNRKLYFIMQTICGTGIRVSELKYITVESLVRKKAVINMKGKMRVIIVPDGLCKILLGYAKQEKIKSGFIFRSKNEKPLDRSNIWKLMKSLCKNAKVAKEKVFPHNLRHLFARTFYSMRKDIVRLADILGHTSVNTTRIYTMESGEIHRRQIQNLGLFREIEITT